MLLPNHAVMLRVDFGDCSSVSLTFRIVSSEPASLSSGDVCSSGSKSLGSVSYQQVPLELSAIRGFVPAMQFFLWA